MIAGWRTLAVLGWLAVLALTGWAIVYGHRHSDIAESSAEVPEASSSDAGAHE
jgi:hypothetical protein